MTKLIIVLLGAFVLSTSALAADSSSGCGMGWYVVKNNSLLSSALRTTTNGLFLNATFGMTFGTSNCAKHSIVQRDKEDLYFAESNKEYLAIELAEGSGEYVATFARTLGCSERAIPAFGEQVRSQYGQVLPSSETTPGELLQNIRSVIGQDPYLAAECQKVVI